MNPIKKICKQLDISRAEMSRNSGIPYATLNVLASGLVNEIRYSTAEKIADFIDQEATLVQEEYRQWKRAQIS